MIESLTSRPGRPGWSRVMVPAAVAIAAVGLLTAAAAAENSDVAGSLRVLAHPRWTWLAAGVALEVISMAAFAAMFRQLLTAGRARPRRSEMLATVYAANARAGMVIASTTVRPDASPPNASRTTQAAVEITPPASSVQPAPAAPAPNRVKRRKR